MATGGDKNLGMAELEDKEIEEGWKSLLSRTHSPVVRQSPQAVKDTFQAEAESLDLAMKKLRMADQRHCESSIKKMEKENSALKTKVEQQIQEAQDLQEMCCQLREKRESDRKSARTKLVALSNRGTAAKKKLQECITKGEKVLQAAVQCEKLERKLQLPAMEDGGQTFGEFEELQRRVNKAQLYRDHLRKQRQDLLQENHQLEVQLQQSSDGSQVVPPDQSTSGPTAAGRRQ